ncbi:MAG: hypothetical protein AABX01_03895 [Candidatus Micrarchaeota archaeon]
MLNELVNKGYYKTKTEAVRAGILELGKEYLIHAVITASPQELEDALVVRKMLQEQEEIRSGKAKVVSFDEVLKKAGIKRSELK